MTKTREIGQIVVGGITFNVSVELFPDGDGGDTILVTVKSDGYFRREQCHFSKDAQILDFSRNVAERAIEAPKSTPVEGEAPMASVY